MLPVLSTRCYFYDGESVEIIETEGETLPSRLEGIELIVYRHSDGLRTIAHGQWEGYWWLEKEGGIWLISGPSMPDDEWESLRTDALNTP